MIRDLITPARRGGPGRLATPFYAGKELPRGRHVNRGDGRFPEGGRREGD